MILFNKNKTLYSGKVRLEYNEEGEGQPLVLIHGLFGNLSNWTDTIRFFSKSNRVITPILPIYNNSWKKDALNELVDYIHTLVAELKLKDIVLVGNSLGGHVSILYTLAHPEIVKNLVLTGSSGLFESNLGVSYPKRGDYNYISDKVRYTFYNEEVVSQSLIDDVYNAINDLSKSIGILRYAKAANRNNVSKELAKIESPTLLIWGKEDRVTPIEVAYQFKDLISGNVELHVIENCGHAPMMEHPEVFNLILSNYLKNDKKELDLVRIDHKQV